MSRIKVPNGSASARVTINLLRLDSQKRGFAKGTKAMLSSIKANPDTVQTGGSHSGTA